MGTFIPGGNTVNEHTLKAGAAEFFIHNMVNDIVMPTVKLAKTDVDITAIATSITTVGDPDWGLGDVLFNPRTKERMVVVTATDAGPTPFETIVVRGCDGTLAAPITAGTTLTRFCFALNTSIASPANINVNDITIVDYTTSNTDIDITKDLVIRRDRSSGSRERMYLIDIDSGTSLRVKRNIMLCKDKKLAIGTAGAEIVDNEFLFVVGQNYDLPEDEDYLLKRWHQGEYKDTITVTEKIESIDTVSNQQSTGPKFEKSRSYEIKFNNVIVDPYFKALVDQNVDLQTNTAYSGQEDEGFDLSSEVGESKVGIMIYIRGREAVNNQRFEMLAVECDLMSGGDLAFGNDQRGEDITFGCVHSRLLDSPGYIRTNQASIPV